MELQDFCKQYIPLVKEAFLKMHKRELDLEHPVTFTEKLQWLKIYDSTFLKTFCADKIRVHDYYTWKLGKDIGVPINKIFKSPDDISRIDIEVPCVLKCNHGSGMNIIIKPDNTMSLDDIRAKITHWFQCDHGQNWGEAYYSIIEPTCFSETYLQEMRDIKVFCFNGIPRFIQVDRHFAEHRMNFYDLKWNPLTWLSRKDYPANYSIMDERPPIEILCEYASKLSQPFKFVRCDFILSGKRIYGGELTFIPGAGNQSYEGDADTRLGQLLQL